MFNSKKKEKNIYFVTKQLKFLKYIADAEKLVYLLQIPTYFDLNQYTLRRQEKSLEKLLKLIQDIVSKHNSSDVLEECSKCLSYLCDEDNSIYIKCNLIRSTILDDLVNSFNSAMSLFDQLTEVDENEMYPLIIALKRLAAFAENHNIVQYNNIVNNAFTILKWSVYNEGFGHDFVNKALNLARSIITWNMYKLNNEMEERANATEMGNDNPDEHPVNKELIEYIAKLNKKFYKLCNKLFVNENAQIEEEAYFELCDLLVLFNIHLPSQHKEYKNLVLECTTNDINMLSVYVMNNVFTQEALNEKADTPESIERLHKRRCILSSFCKLIAFNCVPIKYAAEIFRGYIKYSSSYVDIIKHLLSACRDISKVNTAKTIALSLQREFNEAVINVAANQSASDNNRIDRTSPEFSSLKELAHKFCLSFGPEASVKSREAIVTIHHEAIKYVNESTSILNNGAVTSVSHAPPNLAFLEVIVEFSSRLTAQDKRAVLAELDKTFAKRANKLEENNWQAYYTYRLSLMEDSHSSGANATAHAAANNTTAAHSVNLTSLANNSHLSSTRINNNNENLMPAPSAVGSSSSDAAAAPNDSNKNSRKRRQNTLNNISGISALKDTINEKNKKQDKVIIPEEDDFEDDENVEQNTHAETTANELESLRISAIHHNETNGGRVTRSNRTTAMSLKPNSTNNKRSRSPLASNNSINETLDQNNILSSTRIEPHKMGKNAFATAKGSMGINEINTAGDNVSPMSKRKRRSDDNEQDVMHENNLRERNTNNALSVS